MKRPHPARGRWLCLLLALGCGDDDEKEPPPPPEPPALTILGLLPAGGPAWQEGERCVELGQDPLDQTVYILVGPRAAEGSQQLPGWTLRPFGHCGSAPGCGA